MTDEQDPVRPKWGRPPVQPRPEFATRFQIGRERAMRRMQNLLDGKGCDCPRCLSNEDYAALTGEPSSRRSSP